MKRLEFDSIVCRVEGAMNPHGIPVPNEISGIYRDAGIRRLLVRIKGHEMRRGLQGSHEFGSHLVVGLELLKEIGVGLGDEVTVEVEPDPTPDRVDVCDELLIALEQDEEAKRRWETMSSGKQRSIAHHVTSAKRDETRIKRALDIAMKLRTRTLHGD